jgi:uncharacterized protein
VPILVIAEAGHLLAAPLGVEPEVRFLGDLASGAFAIDTVPAGDWLRIAEVATFDRRHIGAVRPRHVEAFTLLP